MEREFQIPWGNGTSFRWKLSKLFPSFTSILNILRFPLFFLLDLRSLQTPDVRHSLRLCPHLIRVKDKQTHNESERASPHCVYLLWPSDSVVDTLSLSLCMYKQCCIEGREKREKSGRSPRWETITVHSSHIVNPIVDERWKHNSVLHQRSNDRFEYVLTLRDQEPICLRVAYYACAQIQKCLRNSKRSQSFCISGTEEERRWNEEREREKNRERQVRKEHSINWH